MVQFETSMEMKRKFCLMENGYFGWASQAIESEDCVAMFLGARIMFVLRPAGNGLFRMVGECYLHGVGNCNYVPLTDIAII